MPTNTAEYDYREYLARQDVYSLMSRPRVTVLAHVQGLAPLAWLYSFKAHTTRTRVIVQILREPQASLLTGILLGDDAEVAERGAKGAVRTRVWRMFHHLPVWRPMVALM